jgi:hypothetical protein
MQRQLRRLKPSASVLVSRTLQNKLQSSGRIGMRGWSRKSSLTIIAALAMWSFSICGVLRATASAQSRPPPERGKQGWPCADNAGCAPGFGCFKSGPPYYLAYCVVPSVVLYPTGEPNEPGQPAKTCKTPADCGPGDWSCSGGICGYTGEKRCTSDADCHGGWVCEVIGNGRACMPP